MTKSLLDAFINRLIVTFFINRARDSWITLPLSDSLRAILVPYQKLSKLQIIEGSIDCFGASQPKS